MLYRGKSITFGTVYHHHHQTSAIFCIAACRQAQALITPYFGGIEIEGGGEGGSSRAALHEKGGGVREKRAVLHEKRGKGEGRRKWRIEQKERRGNTEYCCTK